MRIVIWLSLPDRVSDGGEVGGGIRGIGNGGSAKDWSIRGEVLGGSGKVCILTACPRLKYWSDEIALEFAYLSWSLESFTSSCSARAAFLCSCLQSIM